MTNSTPLEILADPGPSGVGQHNAERAVSITQGQLRAAVEAGILSADTADRLVAHAMAAADTPAREDEQLRLLTGFGDIFVTIGLALFLGALTSLSAGGWIVTLPVAAWLLAEFFTRRRRMALPSIVLLGVFTGSVFTATYALLGNGASFEFGGLGLAAAGAVAALAAGVHWKRFHVPVTVAAACAAGVGLVAGLATWAWPAILKTAPALVFLPMGAATFALAMWFDASDRLRRTRRTDIAFWLHLLAAPLIVHPLVQTLTDFTSLTPTSALAIVAIFAVLSVIALVIDRRAVLVSSLLYLGYALATLFQHASLLTFLRGGVAPVLLVVGAIILLLSFAWHPLRRGLLALMPYTIRNRVPPEQPALSKQTT